jgi:hypothetical protein
MAFQVLIQNNFKILFKDRNMVKSTVILIELRQYNLKVISQSVITGD